jgi:hypothetical protein
VRGTPRPIAAFLAAVLAAATLAACGSGGSGGEPSSASSASRPPTGESSPGEGAKGHSAAGSKGGESQPSKGSPGAAAVPPLKVSGGGSGQFRTHEGDNSIQNFGDEADETELAQAAEALHSFYLARAAGDWSRACSYLAAAVTKQFEGLASRSPQLKGKDCGAVLHALTNPLPAAVEREITLVDAGSLRQEGERAFLIYRGAEGKAYAVPMQLEGGAWKVGGLTGTPLY